MGVVLIPWVQGSGAAYPDDPVAWTLVWELIVNLGYALWFRRFSSRSLIVCALLLWLAAAAHSYLNPPGWSFGMNAFDIWLAGLRALPGFMMGVVLYRGYRAGWMDRLPAVSPILLVTLWMLVAVMPQGLPPLFDLAVVLLVCPLLLALLVRGEAGAPAWFGLLGGLSYPLYASHLAWTYLARRTAFFGLEEGPDPLRAAGVAILAIAFAWVLYRTVDPAGKRPRRDAKARRFAQPGPLGSTPI